MKTLLLLRHGKSDWSADYDRDIDRPLKGRGRKAAASMGRFLAQTEQAPDRIVTSPAVRAHDTARRAAKAGGYNDRPMEVNDQLYFGGVQPLIDALHRQPGSAETVMLVGHEPVWSAACSAFIGGGGVRFVTAAVARIDFDAEHWADVQPGGGELVWFLPPRLLKGLV
jgi:phosphohistidine phosphatase